MEKWFLMWAILSVSGEVHKSGVEPVSSIDECKLKGYSVPREPVIPIPRDAYKVTTCMKLAEGEALPHAWAGGAFAIPYPLPSKDDMLARIERSKEIEEETRKKGEKAWSEFRNEMDQMIRDAREKERSRRP